MRKLYVTRGSGNCFKPFFASCATGRPLDIVEVDLLGGQHRSPAFLKLNPLGCVPYMVTEDGVGIGESNAMLWLVADGTPFMPETAVQRAQSLQWMFFEQSRLEPFISPARFLGFIAPHLGKGREADIAQWQEKARAGLKTLDAHLANNAFMLGERFGITDMAVFGYVHVADEAGIDMSAFPAVVRWIEQVKAVPDFQPLSRLCETATAFTADSH